MSKILHIKNVNEEKLKQNHSTDKVVFNNCNCPYPFSVNFVLKSFYKTQFCEILKAHLAVI